MNSGFIQKSTNAPARLLLQERPHGESSHTAANSYFKVYGDDFMFNAESSKGASTQA